MKSQNTKSSDELHNEVRHEIRKVRKDIDELQGRISPGQLIDDVIFYPHGRSPAATFDHLKRNPVGTAFLSLGTILLMEDESHQSLETISKNKVAAVRDKVSEAKSKMNMHPTAKELALDKMNEFRDKMDEIKSEVEYKVAAAQDKISKVKDDLDSATPETKNASALKAKVKDKLSGFVSSGKDRIQMGKERIHDMDSTTFMALGAGLGILTGASIPVSDKESSFVDDKFQDKFSGFSSDLQSAINECSNILKDLVVSDVKDFKVNLF